jgi:hypothetical protein
MSDGMNGSRSLLPSGHATLATSVRYSLSLLWPDFHRLDRRSFRLAHLLDHLVGAGKQRGRDFETKRLC